MLGPGWQLEQRGGRGRRLLAFSGEVQSFFILNP